MVTIAFLIISIGLAILANSEKFSFLSKIISVLLILGVVSYQIYKKEYNPFNYLNTKEINNNYNNYLNKEVRLEFTTVLNTEIFQKDEKGNTLVKFLLYNGKSIYNPHKNYKKFEKDAISAYMWVPANSELWETFLQIEPKNWKQVVWIGFSGHLKLGYAAYCKIKISPDGVILTDIRDHYEHSILFTGYDLTYKIFNYFTSQQISGIVALTIELIVLTIVMLLIFAGVSYIAFG
jgi:hypothetical protein